MPGIGTTGTPSAACARCDTHASATCAGVTPSRSATAHGTARSPAFASQRLALEARQLPRKSFVAELGSWSAPVRNPRPSGENGTSATPQSRSAASTVVSGSRVHNEYSLCTAVIGWTAWARRSSVVVDLGQPEVAHLALGDELGHRTDGLLDLGVLRRAVQVVEVDDVDAETQQRVVAHGASRRLVLHRAR